MHIPRWGRERAGGCRGQVARCWGTVRSSEGGALALWGSERRRTVGWFPRREHISASEIFWQCHVITRVLLRKTNVYNLPVCGSQSEVATRKLGTETQETPLLSLFGGSISKVQRPQLDWGGTHHWRDKSRLEWIGNNNVLNRGEAQMNKLNQGRAYYLFRFLYLVQKQKQDFQVKLELCLVICSNYTITSRAVVYTKTLSGWL